MSNRFITNKDKFLSDIINGILLKTNAVDNWKGMFRRRFGTIERVYGEALCCLLYTSDAADEL